MLRVLTRRYADDLFELARHMTLTAEANLGSYLCQWFASSNEPLYMLNPHAFQICKGRHTNLSAKGA
jgi:hypothetical protein